MQPERLQKVLARAGVGSRRKVETLIARGRVRVNGEVASLGRRIDPDEDVVEVDGSRVPLQSGLLHYLANKPRGMVTTASDPEGRSTIMELVDVADRVWPVGRLDYDSEGALVLTNDGELTHRLTHPSFEIPRTYLVEVKGHVTGRALRRLGSGIDLEDGPTAPADAALVDRLGDSSLVEITVREGRNRLVRRMFDAVDYPVERLVRTAIGPLMLGRLKPGTIRKLRQEELRELYRACGL